MTKCYFCGLESTQLKKCEYCLQYFCDNHSDTSLHDCTLTSIQNPYEIQKIEQLTQNNQVSETYFHESPSPTDIEIPKMDQEETYVYTDGSYTWYKKSPDIPDDAFNPESGVVIPGILWPKKSELLHFLIAAILLVALSSGIFFDQTQNLELNPLLLTLSILFLCSMYLVAFLGHEFAHRQTAKHFKLQTKFRLFRNGVIMTVICIFLPIKFALPGAVVVIGLENIGRETGLCKLAGPLSNLIMGLILFGLSFIPFVQYPWNWLMLISSNFNFSLGLFNMLPFGILDGDNIRKWKPRLWLTFFLIFAVLSISNILLLSNDAIFVLFNN